LHQYRYVSSYISLVYEPSELDIMIREKKNAIWHVRSIWYMTHLLHLHEWLGFSDVSVVLVWVWLQGIAMVPGNAWPIRSLHGNTNLRGDCDNGVDNLGHAPYSQYTYVPDWIYNGVLSNDLRMIIICPMR
jgi:hypothetical protein